MTASGRSSMYRPRAACVTAKTWKHVGAGSIGFASGSSYDDNEPEMSVMLTDGRLDVAPQDLTASLRRNNHGHLAVRGLPEVPRDARKDAVEMREVEERPMTICTVSEQCQRHPRQRDDTRDATRLYERTPLDRIRSWVARDETETAKNGREVRGLGFKRKESRTLR